MKHLRLLRYPSNHYASVQLPLSSSVSPKKSFMPFSPSINSSFSSCPRSSQTRKTRNRKRTPNQLIHCPNPRNPFSSCTQSLSASLQSPGDQKLPASLDASLYSLHSDEASLDELAVELDARLAADPDRMPELPDLVALKPPRLQRYLPGMQRQWYIDQVEGVRRRLLRAFSRTQLEHVCRMLGFTQAEERGLSAQGLQRLGALRFAHPSLPVKDLCALVLAEQNPAFEAHIKRRDPSDGAYSKSNLVSFVLFEHWALTDPASIPAEQDFQALVTEFQATSKLFGLPYHELFLLYIEQARDRTGNQLGHLSRRTNVTLELVHEPPPGSSTGLLVRGTMKEREKFWKLFEKLRRPIFKLHIPLPADLGRLIHRMDAEKVLMCLVERAGCYLELGEMEDDKRVLVVYSFDEEHVSSRVLDTLTHFKILSEELASAPVMMSVNHAAGPPALVPFVPSNKPPWFINCRATAFSRLSHPVSRTLIDHSDVSISGLVSVRGHLNSWMSCDDPILDNCGSQLPFGNVNVNAYFGHFVRPHRLPSTPTKTKFFQEFLLPVDKSGQVLAEDDHQNNEENDGSGLGIGGLGGRVWSIGDGGEWVNEFVFVPAAHPLGTSNRLSETNNNFTDDVEASSHPISSSEQAEGGSPVDESTSTPATVEVFKRTSPALGESWKKEWDEEYEVTRRDDGTVEVEKIWRRFGVVMLPSHSMDVLLERERRATLPASTVLPHIAPDGAALCVDGVRYVCVTRDAFQVVPLGRVGSGTVVAEELRRTAVGNGEEEQWMESRITLKDDESREGLEKLVETAIWLAGRRRT